VTTTAEISHAPDLPGAEVAGEGLGDDEWLELRRAGIGGSDIAGLLAVDGAYGTPVTVWQSKVGAVGERVTSVAMEAGHRLEQPLADWFSDETGVKTFQPPLITIYRSKQLPIAQASPDRLAFTSTVTETTAWVEIKNAGQHKFGEWEAGPPPHYLVQCQWQLAVSGLERCYLAALIGGTDFRYYVVEANAKQHKAMFDAAERFWNLYVVTGTPPPVDESEKTRKALLAQYAETVSEPVEGGAELASALIDYRLAKEAEKQAHDAATLAHNRIMAVLREHEVGLVNGEEACRYPAMVRKGYTVGTSTYRKLYVSKQWR